ncbi:MAG: hypothetical protein WC579_01525 [Candidatus Paceibacterota bacterium]
MKTFKHSGDCGDIIYSLPAIRELGGGILYLDITSKITRFRKEQFNMIYPLLIKQSYIKDVKLWNGENIDYNLDLFRTMENINKTNLCKLYLKLFKLDTEIANKKWLECEKREISPVIFARSMRYRQDGYNEKLIKLHKFIKNSIFIGLPEEHNDFEKRIGKIKYYPIQNFLEMAEVINGSKLFIGNQSLPFAISEGLHKNNILEICPTEPNCNFERVGHNFIVEI